MPRNAKNSLSIKSASWPPPELVISHMLDYKILYIAIYPNIDLMCGVFVFSAVSAPSFLPPPSSHHPPTHTHSHTHSLTRSLTHSLTLTHSLPPSLTLSLSLSHSRTHSLPLTHSLPPSLTHSLHSLFCVASVGFGALHRGRMYAPVSPGVPWSPPLCRWLLRGRRSTWCSAMLECTPRGVPAVSPGVPRCPSVSLGLHRSASGFCVAGVGCGALHRGRMHSPVSRGVRPVSLDLRRSAGGFCVAGVGLGARKIEK